MTQWIRPTLRALREYPGATWRAHADTIRGTVVGHRVVVTLERGSFVARVYEAPASASANALRATLRDESLEEMTRALFYVAAKMTAKA